MGRNLDINSIFTLFNSSLVKGVDLVCDKYFIILLIHMSLEFISFI
jgi:hypothetical protein